MRTLTKSVLVLLSTMTFMMAANAHDPNLHVKKAEKADCSKMKDSKLDANDPVAIAMMKKCKKQAEVADKEMDHSDMNHGDMKNAEKKHDTNNEHDHH